MDLDTQAVAVAVAHEPGVAGLVDDLDGGVVDVHAQHPCLTGGHARLLGGQDSVVDLLLLGADAADGDGPGHVRAVALVHAAEVHGDEVPLLHLAHRGDGVGPGAVGAAGHDGGEAHPLGPPGHLLEGELGGDLGLGHARLDVVQDGGEGLVGDALGLLHDGQLLLVFGAAQAHDEAVGVAELHAGEVVLQVVVLAQGHVAVLDAQGLDVVGVQELLDEGGVVALAVHDDHLGVLHALLGHLGVAGVGDEPGGLGGDDAVALGVAAEGVELAGVAGHQHGVDVVLAQLVDDLLNTGHGTYFLSYMNFAEQMNFVGPIGLFQVPEWGDPVWLIPVFSLYLGGPKDHSLDAKEWPLGLSKKAPGLRPGPEGKDFGDTRLTTGGSLNATRGPSCAAAAENAVAFRPLVETTAAWAVLAPVPGGPLQSAARRRSA